MQKAISAKVIVKQILIEQGNSFTEQYKEQSEISGSYNKNN